MGYSTKDNYCEQARKYQSVPTKEEAQSALEAKGISPTDKDISDYREGFGYSNDDSYQMGTIQDDRIYISTTDGQHQQIINGEPPTAQGGISGYFTDQATIDHCTKDGTLDNGQLNRELQIAPFQSKDNPVPSYKPHADCFTIDRDRLQEVYGTRDFNAAIAKCEANNQFGEGGGNQGYNPYLSEMIQNGVLKHDAGNSYSDSTISKLPSDMQNAGTISNSTVSQANYNDMMDDATRRTNDCIQNNTPHPSKQVLDSTGYAPNPDPVPGRTGNAKLIDTTNGGQQVTEHMPTQKHTPDNGQSKEIGQTDGMSTTALGSRGSENDNQRGMPPFRENSNTHDDKKSQSEGMPTTATGQSGHTPSNSGKQSPFSGMNM